MFDVIIYFLPLESDYFEVSLNAFVNYMNNNIFLSLWFPEVRDILQSKYTLIKHVLFVPCMMPDHLTVLVWVGLHVYCRHGCLARNEEQQCGSELSLEAVKLAD